MKNYIVILSLILLSSCNGAPQEKDSIISEPNTVSAAGPEPTTESSPSPNVVPTTSSGPAANTICSGTTILNVAGTAVCSSPTDPILVRSFGSRRDNQNFPTNSAEFRAFFETRTSGTLKEEHVELTSYRTKYSLVPNPLLDSDGRYQSCLIKNNICTYNTKAPEKKHFLEKVAIIDPVISSRAGIVVCGSSGTIAARISNCRSLNGLWSFYDGAKYGQDGEGDWSLVSVLENSGNKYEVWRDERTKLLWSDKSMNTYNWFRAAGYAKSGDISLEESSFVATPGVTFQSTISAVSDISVMVLAMAYQFPSTITLQPSEPMSVCVDASVLNNGEGTPGYTYVNPETDFKVNLSHPQVTWRLPSRNDWLLAEVNGVRKVLPKMDNKFWSSTSYSNYRYAAWYFAGERGTIHGGIRENLASVRCVGSSRD